MQDNTPNLTSPNPPQMQSKEISKKAGFVVRGGAYFIDTLIFSILSIIFSILFPKSVYITPFFGLLTLLYFWVATGLYGTTLGKKFYNLHVQRIDGTKVGLGKAFLRDVIGKFISSLVFSLGYFWVIWDKDKQGWHDKIAKTYVIQDSSVGKGKMFLAYFVVFLGPILAVIGIIGAIVLVAINPTKQIEKARQQQLQYEQQQQTLPDLPQQNQ